MEALTNQLKTGQDLNAQHVEQAASQLLDKSVAVDQKAAFLESLSSKGETPVEIAAFVTEFLRMRLVTSQHFPFPEDHSPLGWLL